MCVYIYIYVSSYMMFLIRKAKYRGPARSIQAARACKADSGRHRSTPTEFEQSRQRRTRATANVTTKILDFKGFDSSIILIVCVYIYIYICNVYIYIYMYMYIHDKGWNSQIHRGFPGSFDSTHLSRDNLSREIGRSEPKDGGQTALPPGK